MNEEEIIEWLRRKFKERGKFHDFYDDVSYIEKGGGEFYAFKVDMLVEGTDVPPGMSPRQISRKAVVSCVSDLISKGSRPLGFMASLGIPRAKDEGWIEDLLTGFLEASDEFEIELLGGDVNEAKETVIDCFMYGTVRRRIGRGGAKKGDLIATVPKFGLPKLGLIHLLYKREIPEKVKKEAVEAVLRPEPPLPLLNLIEDLATSSMDSSDGLAITLNEMARQSEKKFVIERLPCPEGFVEAVKGYGFDPLDLILYGGEEFQPVFTFNEEFLRDVLDYSEKAGVEIVIIGKVEEGSGVFLKRGKRVVKVKDEGWVHLSHE